MQFNKPSTSSLLILTFVVLQTRVKIVQSVISFTFKIKNVHQDPVHASPFPNETYKVSSTSGSDSRQSQGGTSGGFADFFNGFITGLKAALQGGVAGSGTLLNGFGDAANNTFNGLLTGYNSTAQGLIQGVSSFIGNRSSSS